MIEGICVECESEIVGPPLTDESERWWLPRGPWTEWCSTTCRDNWSERAWMRAQERALEDGVPDWRDDAMKAMKLK